MNEEKIISLIREDKWMMDILQAAKSLDLPDWWICAGFIRSKVWDVLHAFSKRTSMPDIDVIYFAPSNLEESVEKELEEKLHAIMPNIPWSVKNEARMHLENHIAPYLSSVDAISKFPETASALGVKLDEKGALILTAPWGIDDVVDLQVRPTPYFASHKERMMIYEKRLAKKNWKQTWNKIQIYS